ncbi:MAG: transglutaminase-like domain-containing protein [Candidatus Paceibacterota bacterium]|jgi:predicted transglutaminase-like cysteine proteinase
MNIPYSFLGFALDLLVKHVKDKQPNNDSQIMTGLFNDHASHPEDLLKDLELKINKIEPKPQIIPVETIRDRAKYICEMILKYGNNIYIREAATKILTQRCGKEFCTTEKAWILEIITIFNYVRKNVRYTRDLSRRDSYFSPARVLLQYKAGDCDDYTMLLGALLYSIGYDNQVVRIVQTGNNTNYNHVYLLVEVPPGSNKWMSLDGSQNKPAGWEVPESMVVKSKDYYISDFER